MKSYHLQNDFLNVEINSLGAEIKKLFSKKWNKQLLWQGDASVWSRTAPVLFPIVGKLKDNEYHLHGKTYQMGQHGFARDMEFECTRQLQNELEFTLRATSETFKNYPFCFILKITYKIRNELLFINYEVINDDRQDIHFSIGAHPGFNTPNLNDYKILFEKNEEYFYRLNNGLVDWENPFLFLSDKMQLSKEMFSADALIFKDLMSSYIDLYDPNKRQCIRMHHNYASYFGIWGKGDCPFICLEPWKGVGDCTTHDKNFLTKKGLNTLPQGEVFQFSYVIELINM